jgi:hypothetical protein
MTAQAKRAYEGYAKSLEIESAPRWDELPSRLQDAWRAAVVAAIDSPPRTESLTDKQVRLLDEMDTVKLGRAVKEMMPPGRVFMLWTGDYGEKGTLAYVSTVEREDAIRTVREWLQRQGAL